MIKSKKINDEKIRETLKIIKKLKTAEEKILDIYENIKKKNNYKCTLELIESSIKLRDSIKEIKDYVIKYNIKNRDAIGFLEQIFTNENFTAEDKFEIIGRRIENKGIIKPFKVINDETIELANELIQIKDDIKVSSFRLDILAQIKRHIKNLRLNGAEL